MCLLQRFSTLFLSLSFNLELTNWLYYLNNELWGSTRLQTCAAMPKPFYTDSFAAQ